MKDMTISADLLREELLSRLELFAPEWSFERLKDHGPCLRLSAKHPATGDLIIWVEDDEITVVIEMLTHSHFNCPFGLSSSSVEEQAAAIAEQTADYILSLLADKLLIEVEWQGDWIFCVSTTPTWDGTFAKRVASPGGRIDRYVWSGPCK